MADGESCCESAARPPLGTRTDCALGLELCLRFARASEAIVADVANGALDPRLVLRLSDSSAVDDEASSLRVLEEVADQSRLKRVGLIDEGLGVVGGQDPEDTAVNSRTVFLSSNPVKSV